MQSWPFLRRATPWLVTAAAVGYVLHAITHQAVWSDSASWKALWTPARPWLLGGLLAGVPLNWGLETVKWHSLTRNPNKRWADSTREVLFGALWGLITPNRAGDAVARVALLPPQDRVQGSRAWAIGAWAQAGWTLSLGSVACIAAARSPGLATGSPLSSAILMQLGLFAACGTALWWSIPRWPMNAMLNRLTQRFGSLQVPVQPAQWLRQITLSGLRYVVFSAQFLLALGAWGFPIAQTQAVAIAVVYLGNMIIPTAALAELGVREALMIAWMAPASDLIAPLLAATFAVWACNLLLPALLGAAAYLMRRHA